jgi:signal transduction histidine kinase
LDREILLIIYQIVQESLTNTTKHSEACRVEVTISGDERSGKLQLQITDDGIGFDVERIGPACRGIKTMLERAAAFGGNLIVVSHPGEGTRIEVTIPADTRSLDGN